MMPSAGPDGLPSRWHVWGFHRVRPPLHGLRLQGISTMEAGNSFAPTFMAAYNVKFARPPRNTHDAHRVLRDNDDLARIFTWQEDRKLSRNLVVHFKRTTYLVEPTAEARALGGRHVQIHESEDGTIQITFEGRSLPYSVFDKHPHIPQGVIVENKRLGAVLSAIQSSQEKRDGARLTSKKLTLREKDRIREARTSANLPGEPRNPATKGERKATARAAEAALALDPLTASPPLPRADRLSAMAAFMEQFGAEQKARRKKANAGSNQRKRDRELRDLRAPDR
jgi:hypothetical protein